MIQKIKSHRTLERFVEDTCCENGVCVSFDDNLLPTSYAIVKVDKYYNSLKLEKTPASIDCLIVRECTNGGFGLTLVELKSIETGQGFTLENMKEKFETALYDFIKKNLKQHSTLTIRKRNYILCHDKKFTKEI